MVYALDDFCRDTRAIVKSSQPLELGLSAVADRLAALLANETFVAQTFKPEDDFAKKQLFHDPETDFYVLAHVHQGPKEGAPHSHGSSWAVYGTAKGVTGMKEWRRTNREDEPAAVLQLVDQYELAAGQTRGYGPHRIHSTRHPGQAWVIRVTGTNLDNLPRYRFNKQRDSLVDAA